MSVGKENGFHPLSVESEKEAELLGFHWSLSLDEVISFKNIVKAITKKID